MSACLDRFICRFYCDMVPCGGSTYGGDACHILISKGTLTNVGQVENMNTKVKTEWI